MQLRILLPFRVFAEVEAVSRIVVETTAGSMGLLPQRLDCVASLVLGILEYQTEANGIVYVALDEGVMAKTGATVLISVRRAIDGSDLGQLHAQVVEEFLTRSVEEQATRSVMAKLEAGFLHRLASLQHE